MGSSPGFVSNTCDWRPVQTRFRFGFGCTCLNLPQTLTRRLILQKARGQACTSRRTCIALPPIVSARFQILFHSPNRGSFHLSLTVLVHYRSSRVFSLGEWSPLLPTGLACPVVLRITVRCLGLSSTGLSPCSAQLSSLLRLACHILFTGPTTPHSKLCGLGFFPFARHYSGNRFFSWGY